MNDLTADIIGWIGAGALLLAYGLISAGKLAGDDLNYQGLNVAGSLGLMFNSAWYGAFPSAALNVIWIGIGLFTLRNIFRKRKAD